MSASALIDTGLLLAYLQGDPRAQAALAPYEYRSVGVLSWLELMAQCPNPELLEPTRGFLRTFERLSISESTADEALRLMRRKPGLSLTQALAWATAVVNRVDFLTLDPDHLLEGENQVRVPFR